ncbi:MAG: glycosyl transferase [Roseiflexus castenholzii]|uniref:transglycosylase domain-containing protein n=1 Tax=Roseiflexus castenholzii TaxID=120962 RepID=UPI000CC04CA2|nr:MAG: glycosyl transferase [Roseiflexus castenholzii]
MDRTRRNRRSRLPGSAPLPPGMLRRGRAIEPDIPMGRVLARLTLAFLALGVLVSLGVAGVAYGAYSDLAASLKPRLAAIENRESFETTRLYDRNGQLLYEFFGAGKRTRVSIDQVSTYLISATVAIEDRTFFENRGVDYLGIARTLLTSLQAGEETGGASTITQQLIKNVVLSDEERRYENRYQRKLIEIILAQELSEQYSKNDILELYLNEIYYGNLAYGIEAAANVYFGIPAKDLNLPQAALLAGLPQLPNVYDPFNYLDGGVLKGVRLGDGWLSPAYRLPTGTPPPKWRQVAVLRQMVDEGIISDPIARRAAAVDLAFASQDVPLNAPHFVFYVRRLLEEEYGPQFANMGLSVYTTIDLDLQRMAQEKAAERIQELEARNIHNAAVVILQPNTGQILAMVGSIDYNKTIPTKTPGESGNVLDGQVNVTVRERQPGSALKPFTYLAAMERGMTPETVIWDVPTKFPLIAGEWYEPQNYNGRWNGPVRMRAALANSLNMPAVKALKYAGIDETISLLRRAGITTLQRGSGFYGLALTLGGGEVTPLELTTAYNTLASGGRYYPPVAILKVVDSSGRTLQEFRPTLRPQTLNPDHVAIITDMLSDDAARAPVWGLNSKLKLSRPAAVKTGTSNDWRDAWAVGYTPYVTVGVWTGNNNNEPTKKVESLTGGGVIWHNIMEELFANPKFQRLLAEPYLDGRLPLDFTKPSWLVRKPICPLPGPYHVSREELFAPDMLPAGSVPVSDTTQLCRDIFTEVQVVRLSDTPIETTSLITDTAVAAQWYCAPGEGQSIASEQVMTILTWNVPPPDPDEQIVYTWEGMQSAMGDQTVAPIVASAIPPCTAEMLTPHTPPVPGAVRMPDLRRFGENQAKEQLAALGIFNVYVDYQTRDRIPDVFDDYAPYAVVSTLPAPGEWIDPNMTVVLGVRAP